MGNVISDILPHPGGSQLGDPLNVHSWSGGALDPYHLFGPNAAEQGAEANLTNLGQLATQLSTPLFEQANSGTLTPGQQAEVTSFENQKNRQNEFMLAKAGLGRSSTEVELKNQTVLDAQQYANQFITQDFQEGLALLGAASGDTAQAAQLTLEQDQMMGQALGNAANALGSIAGSYQTPNTPGYAPVGSETSMGTVYLPNTSTDASGLTINFPTGP